MTTDDTLRAGKHVLGIFFLVEGLVTAVGALAVVDIQVPDGASRSPLVFANLAQATVFLTAGIILMRPRPASSTSSPASPFSGQFIGVAAVQLLGVYFAVLGLVAVARAGVSMWIFVQHWETRVADVAGALIELAAGVLLMTKTNLLVRLLSRVPRHEHNGPSGSSA